MDAPTLVWQLAGIVVLLVGAIYALLLWEIRRVGRGVHSLRTEVTDLLLPIEKDVRELQRAGEQLKGRLEESDKWRATVLELIKMVIRQP